MNLLDSTLYLRVTACHIVPNGPGGVVLDIGRDATINDATPSLRVADCEFTLQGSESSYAAIDAAIEAFNEAANPPGPLHTRVDLEVVNTVIDSTAAVGGSAGFQYGIDLGAEARYGGGAVFGHNEVFIQNNRILGCRQAGVRVLAYTVDASSAVNIQSWFFDNNEIRDNLQAGVLFDGGDASIDDVQYIRFYLRGNMIVDNGGNGIDIREIAVGNSGQFHLLNCTIVGNAGHGIAQDNVLELDWFSHVQNSIVWGNSLGSSSNWNPGPNWPGKFQHNIWAGTPPVSCVSVGCNPSTNCDNNVDVDPLFVDAPNGDYHITDSSCAIDGGTNTPDDTSTQGFIRDIDGQRRTVDGDGNGSILIDIGADERLILQ